MPFYRFFIFLILVVVATGLSVPVSAAVAKWPYQLDPAFSSDGYDRITTSDSAHKVVFDGNDAIVATTRPRSDGGGGVEIVMYRYGPDGVRKKWSESGQEARVVAWFGSPERRFVAVRGMYLSESTGRVLISADVRDNLNPDKYRSHVFALPLTGAQAQTIYISDPSSTNDSGLKMAYLTGESRLLLLRQDQIASKWISLLAFQPDSSVPSGWTKDTSWGTNGERMYQLVIGSCPSMTCHLVANQLEISQLGNIYVAGHTPNYGPYIFLLKLDRNGSEISTHGDWGWVLRRQSDAIGKEEVAGIVTRSYITSFFPPPGTWVDEVFLLSTFKRACGEGLLVYRYNTNGSFGTGPNNDNARSWTHGGGSSGSSCAPLRGKGMVQIQDGKLAVLANRLASATSPDETEAVLITMDPNLLADNLGQEAQYPMSGRCSGSSLVSGTCRYEDIAYHKGLKRLYGVGRLSTYFNFPPPAGWTSGALVSRLKEAPLFADDFEGN